MLQYRKAGCVQIARTELVTLGSENRGLQDDGWHDTQVSGDLHTVAFSLLPIEVAFEGAEAVTLSPATVALARASAGFRRTPVSVRGQRTIFFSTGASTIREIASSFDAGAADSEDPFPARTAPSSGTAMALIRQLERFVFHANACVEPVLLDELAMQIIRRSLHSIYRGRGAKPRRRKESTLRAQRDCVDQVVVNLCLDPARQWTLSGIAADVSLSAAYLSRIFREHTGRTLFQCLKLIRMVRALEQLPDRRGDLTALALDCGFSSHAHMTASFSKVLGAAPSTLACNSAKTIKESIKSLKQRLPRDGGGV